MVNQKEISKSDSWPKVAFGDVGRNVGETVRDP